MTSLSPKERVEARTSSGQNNYTGNKCIFGSSFRLLTVLSLDTGNHSKISI